MSRTVKGTKYRKWKGRNSSPQRGRPGYSGRVHLQYWAKTEKTWLFLCGKRDEWGGGRGDVVDDDTPITCTRCVKHAPDVVEKMEDVPSLDEFQDLPVRMDEAEAELPE